MVEQWWNYVPVAFIQVTTVIRFPLSADVREANSFLPLMLTTLLCLCCTVLICFNNTENPVAWMINLS